MDNNNDEIKDAIRVVLNTPEGRTLYKHIFDTLMVLDTVAAGLPHERLIEFATIHRCGNAFFREALTLEPTIVGNLITEMENKAEQMRRRNER